MGAGPLVVTYPLTGRSRAIVEEELGGTAEAIYLVDLAPTARAHALGRAVAVLSHDTSKELWPDAVLPRCVVIAVPTGALTFAAPAEPAIAASEPNLPVPGEGGKVRNRHLGAVNCLDAR